MHPLNVSSPSIFLNLRDNAKHSSLSAPSKGLLANFSIPSGKIKFLTPLPWNAPLPIDFISFGKLMYSIDLFPEKLNPLPYEVVEDAGSLNNFKLAFEVKPLVISSIVSGTNIYSIEELFLNPLAILFKVLGKINFFVFSGRFKLLLIPEPSSALPSSTN